MSGEINRELQQIFERNDGNRITADLALGMLSNIQYVMNKTVADAVASARAEMSQQSAQEEMAKARASQGMPSPTPTMHHPYPQPAVEDVQSRAA